MTYFNLSLTFLLVLTASSCGQELSVNPSSSSTKSFEGDQFRRVCLLTERPSWVSTVFFRWLKDGVVVRSLNTSESQILLDVAAISMNDAGTYRCEATVFDAAGTRVQTLTPTSGEVLIVINGELLDAPSVQVGVEGEDFSLTCSYGNSIVTWLDGVDGSFSPLRVEDEGNYICSILVILGSGEVLTVTREISLLVEVPVRIESSTLPVHQKLTQNQPLSLSISFTGRVSHNLTVTWYHNNTAISTPNSRIVTDLNPDTTSTSTLTFSPAQRADRGIYRVEVFSVVGGNPPSRDNRTFQLDIKVGPSHPASLAVIQTSSSTARATWQLTNTTADSGAHTLELVLTYTHNRSHANTLRLPGDTISQLLEGLAPATNYTMQVTAINPDGMASSHTQTFVTREGRPLLNTVRASHVNSTHIAIWAEVAYTGGGVIQTIKVTYGPGLTRDLQEVEPVDDLQYRAFLEMEESSDESLVLDVSVVNQHNYESYSKKITVLPHEDTTEPLDDASTNRSGSPDSTSSSLPLPLWLMAVLVILAVVIVGLLIIACVSLACCKCRRTKKITLPVSALNKDALQNVENGSVRQENVYSPSHSSTEEFRSRSSTEEFRSRSQTGSLASTSGGRTPSLDKINHKRVPSDCSSSNISITKPTFSTPTTTASSSPSNLVKTGGYASQEQGLGRIIEMEPLSHTSNDSGTESDRDHLHRMKCEEDERDKNNMINAELHRAPGDGSPCDSHQSLVPAGSNLMISVSNPALLSYDSKVAHSDSRLYPLTSQPRTGTPAHEYMYSDCESVASTEVSLGNSSLPPHHYPTHHPHHLHHPSRHYYSHTPRHSHNTSLKSVHERTATPFNRDYNGEGSMV